MENTTFYIRSLIMTANFIHLFLAVVALIHWSIFRKHHPGTGHWALGILMGILGGVLVAARGHIGDFFSIFVAQMLIVGAIAVYVRGICIIEDLPRQDNVRAVVMGIFGVAIFYFGLLLPAIHIRHIAIAISEAIFSAQVVYLLYKHSSEKDLPERFAIGLFSIHFLACLTVVALSSYLQPTTFGGPVIYFNVVRYSALSIGVMVYFILKINRRLTLVERRLVREKQDMIRMVHHRTKNSLSLIQSLLKLQSPSKRSAGAEPMALLIESGNRIHSIGLMHDMLSRNESELDPDGEKYLRELAAMSFNSWQPRGVRLDVNVSSPLGLGVSNLLSVGLITNELISNACRHAFGNRSSGRIAVSLLNEEGDKFKLIVRDNGTGLPAGMDAMVSDHMGLKIVRMLTREIAGTMSVTSTPGEGTEFAIEFHGGRLKRQ